LSISPPTPLFTTIRYPNIAVESVTLNQLAGGAYEFAENPQYPKNLNAISVKLNLRMLVNIYNPNPYPLTVSNIDISANLFVNTTIIEKENVKPITLSLEQTVGPVLPPPAGVSTNGYVPSTLPRIGFSKYTEILELPSKNNISVPMLFTLQWSPDPVVG
jgi:hypothetical protein